MPVCTWDPIRKSTAAELSNGNLTVYMPKTTAPAFGTLGRNKGKHYFEITASQGKYFCIGIANGDYLPDTYTPNIASPNQRSYGSDTGAIFPGRITYGEVFGVGDYIGVAVDMDNGSIEFYKNGISQGIAFNDLNQMGMLIYPFVTSITDGYGAVTVTANFGATPFRYPLEGFLPWTDDSEEPVEPSEQAILRVTMIDSSEREYKLPKADIDGFITWFTRTVGTGTSVYVLNKMTGSKEYLAFDKIISFEVIPVA